MASDTQIQVVGDYVMFKHDECIQGIWVFENEDRNVLERALDVCSETLNAQESAYQEPLQQEPIDYYTQNYMMNSNRNPGDGMVHSSIPARMQQVHQTIMNPLINPVMGKGIQQIQHPIMTPFPNLNLGTVWNILNNSPPASNFLGEADFVHRFSMLTMVPVRLTKNPMIMRALYHNYVSMQASL